jgi:hypothetical protein
MTYAVERRKDEETRKFITQTEDALLGKRRVNGKIKYDNAEGLWEKLMERHEN